MKIKDIVPVPSEEIRKTRKLYFNPENGEYVTYSKAYALKRKGKDIFQNAVDVPDEDRTPVLEERLRLVNLTLEFLTKAINE